MNDKAEFQTRFQKLAPIIYYGDIYENVQLSVLSKRPNDKVYAYCEVMPGAGNLEMIVCITDGCIECSYADSFEQAHVWSEKILDTICLLGMRLDWYAKYYMEKKKGNWPMKMELDDKLTSGFIEAYIPSMDTAAYLRSINYCFSEIEKATIIGNHSGLLPEEKLEALQRMRELAKDEKLCKRLEQAMQLIWENKHTADSCSVWDAFHDFFPIPHDFRHGDIVHFVGKPYDFQYGDNVCFAENKYHNYLGVVLGYDEKVYEFYCNLSGDYSDVQIAVDTRFLIKGYDADCNPIYDYLGEFSHEHMNPIYVERARLGHENECGWYLKYLAACGTPNERNAHMLAEKVIIRQLGNVWQYYPKLSMAELMITAAKVGKLCVEHPQMPVKELIGLPEADVIDIAKVQDFEVMDGLFYMLPKSVKKI